MKNSKSGGCEHKAADRRCAFVRLTRETGKPGTPFVNCPLLPTRKKPHSQIMNHFRRKGGTQGIEHRQYIDDLLRDGSADG